MYISEKFNNENNYTFLPLKIEKLQ